jgi:hypothetical protein
MNIPVEKSCKRPIVLNNQVVTPIQKGSVAANDHEDMRDEIDGLVTDIKMIHERVDSTVTMANARFDQLDLAQTATKTTLDAIMS